MEKKILLKKREKRQLLPLTPLQFSLVILPPWEREFLSEAVQSFQLPFDEEDDADFNLTDDDFEHLQREIQRLIDFNSLNILKEANFSLPIMFKRSEKPSRPV